MKSSIVNIESVTNSSFGTGFVVHSDEKGVYILTCKHVVEEVINPVVENVLAKIVAMGNFIDMAVLYVPKLQLNALPLEEEQNNNLDVSVIGFSHFNQSSIQKKHIEATLYKELIELHAKEEDIFYNLRKIKAKDGFNFDRGNSGSPVICLETNKVIAMISNKEGSDLAYAINIEYIKEIWKDIPVEPFNKVEQFYNKPDNLKKLATPYREYVETASQSNNKFGKYFLLSLLVFGALFYWFQLDENSKGEKTLLVDDNQPIYVKEHSRNRTINYESGDVYKGEVKKHNNEYVPDGEGTYTYFNNNKYIGIFKNGKPHGKGTFYYNNGNKYIGAFIAGRPHGKGTAYYYADDKYIGFFKDGKRNGIGTFYYNDGNKCKGRFKDDLPIDKMKCTFTDGFKLEAFYKNGLPVGKIILYDNNGHKHNIDSSDAGMDFNNDEMYTMKLYE